VAALAAASNPIHPAYLTYRSDITGDGMVNAADLAILLGDWGSCVAEAGSPCRSDLDTDGIVGAADFAVLLGDWQGSSTAFIETPCSRRTCLGVGLDAPSIIDPELELILAIGGFCSQASFVTRPHRTPHPANPGGVRCSSFGIDAAAAEGDPADMLLAAIAFSGIIAAADRDTSIITPVPFTAVKITDAFWAPRIETNRTVTIPACFKQCEETGRIANFDAAAAVLAGKPGPSFKGNCYDDSDVYKVMEGAAYSLSQHPDPELDAYLDRLITKIAAAQEPDGYLYTIATANKRGAEARWKDEQWSHETYCAGHMFEAAVAHSQATGKRSFLDVATKVADLLVTTYLPSANANARKEVPGHQEVEIGLVRLYRVTKKQEYLDLARHFLAARGVAEGRTLYGDYCQDHAPLLEQRTAVGHAVRAGYLYTGMADVAAITGESTFDASLEAIWNDCVGTKMHITGGIGAFAHNEGFGDSYDLPNESAYLETCAAIANCLWNHRMFLRSGDSAPIDVLERTLYNGMLSGVSLSGDRFFYPNPLAADGMRRFNHGTNGRAPWFGCACCPVNVARFIPSVGGLVYAVSGGDEPTLWTNLFVGSEATVGLGKSDVHITQTTEYPFGGKIEFTIEPSEPTEFTLAIRIPGWVRDRPVPGELYSYLTTGGAQLGGMWVVAVNGNPLNPPKMSNGYALVKRAWKKGDHVTVGLPISVRRVLANEKVAADKGRVALSYGPLVFAVEATDANGSVSDLVLPDDASLTVTQRDTPVKGTPAILISGKRVVSDGVENAKFAAIPYALWANRGDSSGVGEMAVWLPRTKELARAKPPETIASRAIVSASHVWSSDSELAVNDRRLPASSADGTIPRHTFWPHKGSETGASEWLMYEWKKRVTLKKASVYFFDDTGAGGGCALPKSWRLLAKQGDTWIPIEATFPIERDKDNVVTFPAITTSALRLEMTLAEDRSAGVLEWTVE
jgi:DUF1680 family protein